MTVDASNTGEEWVSDFTPGLIFNSDSGFDYAANPTVSAVPEPGTVGLFSAGLGLIVAWARRRSPGGASHRG